MRKSVDFVQAGLRRAIAHLRVNRSWRAVLFLLPLAIVFGVPGVVLWLGGELSDPNVYIHRELAGPQPLLNGRAYTDSTIYVKSRLIAQQRPQILALGNSRVLQFRREFFRPGVTFYNAGGIATRIRHFPAFLEDLPPEALPETLIVATDAPYFNLQFDKVDEDALNVAWLHKKMALYTAPLEICRTRWREVWGDIYANKINWTRLISLDGLGRSVGLNALGNDAGLRNDGSYRYGAVDLNTTNRHHGDRIALALKDIAKGGGRFPWGDTVSSRALSEVDSLLEFCGAHHIYVIGFMPPHAHAVWAAMQAAGNKYDYVKKLEPELRSRFEGRGFEFYNFSDLAALGSSDSEAIDGYHGCERAYLRMAISMLKQGSRLNAVANLPELQSALAASAAPRMRFPNRSR